MKRSLLERAVLKMKSIINNLLFRSYIINKKLDGVEIKLKIHNILSKEWYDREHQWVELIWVKKNLISENDFIIDCGAHNGFTSLFFCIDFNKVTAVAFEALPANALAAMENISINGLSERITVVNNAVSSKEGEVVIFNQSNSGITQSKHRNTIHVKSIKLDEYNFEKNPTVLKIDVEGHELEVLKGAKRILTTRPKLDIEIHACLLNKSVIEEIFQLIDLSSYKSFIQLEVDGTIDVFDNEIHNSDLISKKEVVHFFAIPNFNE